MAKTMADDATAGDQPNRGGQQVDAPGTPFAGGVDVPWQLRRSTQGSFEGLSVAIPQDALSRAYRGEPPVQPETTPETEGTGP